MKSRILEILRAEQDVASGTSLSENLGISRVSIWKHIKKLQECGYTITATPNGYRLTDEPDVPYPWEFSETDAHIHYYDELPSTMNTAREKARKGCPDFTVIVAGKQKKGRGRLNRTWVSADGGLYFTVVVRPLIPPFLSAKANFSASLILVKTLRDMFEVPATVKMAQ